MLQLLENNLKNIEQAKENLKEEKALYLAQYTVYIQEYDKQIQMLKELIEEYHKNSSAIVAEVKRRGHQASDFKFD